MSSQKKLASYGLNNKQVIVLIGIAVTGLISFASTADSASGLSTAEIENPDLQAKYNKKFIIVIIFASLALAIGICLSAALYYYGKTQTVVSTGLILAGILAFLYSIFLKNRNVTNKVKLVLSWGSFSVFVLLGFLLAYYGTSKQGKGKGEESEGESLLGGLW